MHQFNAAPLDKVWLTNGVTEVVLGGRRLVRYEGLEGIQPSLFRAVVLKPALLAPREIAFLRRSLDLSQKDLGETVGSTAQTFGLWERGAHSIQPSADLVLRRHCIEAASRSFRSLKIPTIREMAAFTRRVGEYIFEGTWLDGHWTFTAKPIRVLLESQEVGGKVQVGLAESETHWKARSGVAEAVLALPASAASFAFEPRAAFAQLATAQGASNGP